jgi:hypothetical protein
MSANIGKVWQSEKEMQFHLPLRLQDDRVHQVKKIFLGAILCLCALVAYFFIVLA